MNTFFSHKIFEKCEIFEIPKRSFDFLKQLAGKKTPGKLDVFVD